MGRWDFDPSIIPVTGHQGARTHVPGNTMAAFRYAIGLGVDVIETDIRQTKDHQLVLIHDEYLDDLTDGKGFIRDLTLEEIRRCHVTSCEDFQGSETVPTLKEFLELVKPYPSLLLNLELKDHPHLEGMERAYDTADRVIAMVEEYGLGDRVAFNSFSGNLLEHIDTKYHHRYPLQGFYPYFYIGTDHEKSPEEFMTFACMRHNELGADGKRHPLEGGVCPKEWFDFVIEKGMQPWMDTRVKSREEIRTAYAYGARMLCSDDPEETLALVRELGLHP